MWLLKFHCGFNGASRLSDNMRFIKQLSNEYSVKIIVFFQENTIDEHLLILSVIILLLYKLYIF